jgi:cysteine desulfurase
VACGSASTVTDGRRLLDLPGLSGLGVNVPGTVAVMPSEAYFDAASAVPQHPVVAEALAAALADGWADPSRLYARSRRAAQLLDAARAVVADATGARPDEVSFAPNGTAAAHHAVLGLLAGRRRAGPTFVHSAIEHSAVLHAAEHHEAGLAGPGRPGSSGAGSGRPAVPVGVDRLGRVSVDGFAAEVARPGVAAAALLSASHEVGTVQPVAEVAAACAEHGVPLYVDAAQSLGRAPVPGGWSVLTASAHKWGGPPGVGVLVVRKGTRWRPDWPVDERESGRVPGALNLPAVVAAAAALRAALAERDAEDARLRPLVDRIRATVAATVPDVEVVGDPVHRLPNLVTFSCLYVDGEALLHALDAAGFAVSSGSSCTASTLRPSHVLEAMGVLSHGNVRVSLHRGTTESDVDRFLDVLPGIVARLRAEAGVVGL